MLVNIFYEIDEFCKYLEKNNYNKFLLTGKGNSKKNKLTLSEIMTIYLYYQYSEFKNFKEYYKNLVLKKDFPNKLSYSRFIELKAQIIVPMRLLIEFKLKKSTGISIIDSTSIKSCHIKRACSNKTLKNISKKSKTSLVWFYLNQITFSS